MLGQHTELARPGRGWLARWVGAPVALACVVAWLTTLIAWWRLGPVGCYAELEHGCLTVRVNDYVGVEDDRVEPVIWLSDLSGYDLWARLARMRWLPQAGGVHYGRPIPDSFDASLPLWIPALLGGFFGSRAWVRHLRGTRGELCPVCGYSRQGLPASALCPECGKPPA